MEKITVAGAGTMGHSITLSAAWAGFTVTMLGMNEQDVSNGLIQIKQKLNTLEEHRLIASSEINQIMERIVTIPSIDEIVKDTTLLIEAIPEDLALKQQYYTYLDESYGTDVILASNTSGLSPTKIAEKTKNPERILVAHFWNPAHLIPLVEVVRGEKTSDEAVRRTMDCLIQMNKKPIEVKKDVLGFVGNRLQYALFREAQHLLEMGVASAEDIDAAVTYSFGRRLPVTGPFMTADLGGLDVFHAISNYLFEDLSKADRSLSEMQRLVEEGKYGFKTGSGFYKWNEGLSEEIQRQREAQLIHFLKEDFSHKDGVKQSKRK